MKKLMLSMSLAKMSFTELASANPIEASQCYQAIQGSQAALHERKSFSAPTFVMDSALVAAASVVMIPTLAASLPIGAVVMVGRDIGASVVKEARVAGHRRLLNLLQESSEFVKDDSSKELNNYPALKELWVLVNGPIFKRIKPEQVAESVLSAQYDVEFCKDNGNFRMVHFKDYVIDHIDS